MTENARPKVSTPLEDSALVHLCLNDRCHTSPHLKRW